MVSSKALKNWTFEPNTFKKKTKKKLKSKSKSIFDAIEAFCASTGINALKYFADKNRNWFERWDDIIEDKLF